MEPEFIPENLQFGSSANTTDGAHLNIAVNGFWSGKYEKSFIDVCVFNLHSTTKTSTSIHGCY